MELLEREQQLIKILEEVKATGSISQTATTLFMTQPTVSKLIRNQEKRYGISLIDRSKHPLVLSQAGEYYLERMRKLVQSYQNLGNNLRNYASTETGRLTIGLNPSLAQVLLPVILPPFHSAFPNITLQLIERSATAMEAAVRDGDIDLYIGLPPVDAKAIGAQKLLDDTAVLLLPKTADVVLPDKLDATAISLLLKGRDFILETSDSAFQRLVNGYLTKYAITPNTFIQTPNISTALRLAATGLGAAIVPQSLLPLLRPESQVHIIPLAKNDYDFQIVIAHNLVTPLSTPTKLFIESALTTMQRKDPTVE